MGQADKGPCLQVKDTNRPLPRKVWAAGWGNISRGSPGTIAEMARCRESASDSLKCGPCCSRRYGFDCGRRAETGRPRTTHNRNSPPTRFQTWKEMFHHPRKI